MTADSKTRWPLVQNAVFHAHTLTRQVEPTKIYQADSSLHSWNSWITNTVIYMEQNPECTSTELRNYNMAITAP